MKKAIILIHGFLTDTHDFDKIMPFVEANYDKVLRIQLPGHGTDTDSKNFQVDATINTVVAAYKSVENYEIIDIIGFSMGGALATYLASNYRVSRLILMAPANHYINLLHELNQFEYFASYIESRHNNEALDLFYKEIHEDNKIFRNMALNQVIPRANLHYLLTFVKLISKINRNFKDITAPTLLLWGEMDQLVPRRTINYIKRHLKGVYKIKTFSNISHLMLYSYGYQIIVDEIVGFLK